MDVWILGCGPSLRDVEIPPEAFTIGTNNSYKHHWSPVWCGTDFRALRRDYAISAEHRPLVWITAIEPTRVSVAERPGRPLIYIPKEERITLRKAGVLAYWAAIKLFGATSVHLIGFDMEGDARHFDNSKLTDQTYISQRYQMVKLQKETGVPSWIWIEDSFYPVSALPTTGYELKGLKYVGRENDVEDGFPMPQDYWRGLSPEWYEARRKKAQEMRDERNKNLPKVPDADSQPVAS